MTDHANDRPLLEMRGICKRFPGVQALADVDFVARRGEIHALMGENGAGKSTLIKVLTGVHPRDSGDVLLDGGPFVVRSPKEAQEGGVSTVYQEINLIPHLSVAENICLGRQPGRFGRIDWRGINRRAESALDRIGLRLDVTQALSSCSIAIQQMVAIARALDILAKLLILDEPTSSLDIHEVERLFEVLRKLKTQDLGIVFITHFLDQVYQIADRITVLRNGLLVGEFETAKLPRVELVAKMLGKEIAEVAGPEAREPESITRTREAPFLQVRGLGKRGAVEPLDIDVSAGEVLGLAGLLGSGRTETAKLLFGIQRSDTGRVLLDGKRAAITSPQRAIRCRFGFCPEDRQAEGLIPELSVRENIVLAIQGSRGWARRLPRKRQIEIADAYIRALGIATPSPEQRVKNLSGGNQQKVILARWLASEPRFLILDEPTRGIDVGAKAEVEALIASLCREGVAILFISSELEEVVRRSHRVIVLRDRAKIAELAGDEITEQSIMHTIARHD